MMRRLLVLRPEPGASATAERAAARGWTVIKSPLFEVRACDWSAPDAADQDAVMMTSANAARLGGKGLAGLIHLPLYAVGAATAEAARGAGFTDIRTGTGDGAALLQQAAADGVARLLHLAGRDHRDLSHAAVAIERRMVYRSDPTDMLSDEAAAVLNAGAIALLHSPRAASRFALLVREARIARAMIRIAAISAAALEAAGPGWAAAATARSPNDDALLAAAALCD
jgi:uroporphyrinogen-III synthase